MSQAQPLSESSPDALSSDAKAGADVNVSQMERTVSLAAGALLVGAGLSRKSLPGALIAAVGGGLIYRGVSGHCHVYEALGIDTASGHGAAQPEEYFNRGIHVEHVVTINRLPWELYDYWRKFENLPRIMSHLDAVNVIDDKRSHWVAKAPAGQQVEWDAEIINDEPGALIAWRSLGGADVDNAGSVRFVPADRGTEVKVVIDYIPPAGRIGAAVAKLFGEEPQQQLQDDLRNFKSLMETGEVPTTEGQSQGTGA
jgi:uncharacterized membrane protein